MVSSPSSTKKNHHRKVVLHLRETTGLDCRFAPFGGQIVSLPPVFELVAAICHWHIAFRWVRVLLSAKRKSPPKGGAAFEGDNRTRLPICPSGDKSYRCHQFCQLVAAICHRHIAFRWVRVLAPPKKSPPKGGAGFEGGQQDSMADLSLWGQIV